ncbi:exonuclease domain-containing protein [Streptomyces sp. NPDC093261]|uniref:exonuclease domain-containing protein n=1 Tax=Streptomyces sp. NPDC093261 TaxID=3366037 RepID=UPI0037F9458E
MYDCLSFDTETDGPEPEEARIISAALVRFTDGIPVERHTFLLQPERPIPPEAIAVHGITTEHAEAEGVDRAEALGEIARLLALPADSGVPIVVFNARYDLTLMDRELARVGLQSDLAGAGPVYDPLVLDRELDRYRKGKRTLGACCAHYGIRLDNAHSADADAEAAGWLTFALIEAFPDVPWHLPWEVHARQQTWAAGQAARLQKWFDSKLRPGEERRVTRGEWPLIPTGSFSH